MHSVAHRANRIERDYDADENRRVSNVFRSVSCSDDVDGVCFGFRCTVYGCTSFYFGLGRNAGLFGCMRFISSFE